LSHQTRANEATGRDGMLHKLPQVAGALLLLLDVVSRTPYIFAVDPPSVLAHVCTGISGAQDGAKSEPPA